MLEDIDLRREEGIGGKSLVRGRVEEGKGQLRASDYAYRFESCGFIMRRVGVWLNREGFIESSQATYSVSLSLRRQL